MDNKNEILQYLNDNKMYFKNKYFVERIALIGSFARDEQTDVSDIDLLIYFMPEANEHRIFRLYLGLQEEMEKSSGKKIDIIVNGKTLPAFKEIIQEEAIYV